MKILVINGPNLNMLGIREPEYYGRTDYNTLTDGLTKYCSGLGIECVAYQSNHEGDLVDIIQKAYFDKADGIVINPGAYTHTSIAILDAVKATALPCVEVHISKLEEREDFRQVSYIRQACIATVSGKGVDGYYEAIDLLCNHIGERK